MARGTPQGRHVSRDRGATASPSGNDDPRPGVPADQLLTSTSTVGTLPWFERLIDHGADGFRVGLPGVGWALPDYDPARRQLRGASSTPVQVQLGPGGCYICTCQVYQQVQECLHVQYARHYEASTGREPPPAADKDTVVPVATAHMLELGAVRWYWVDGCWVEDRLAGLRCSHRAHGCNHSCVKAVAARLDYGEELDATGYSSAEDDEGLHYLDEELAAAERMPKYPSKPTLAMQVAFRKMELDGPPKQLEAEMPALGTLCACGCEYSLDGYVEVMAWAHTYKGPHFTVPIRHRVLNCPNNRPECCMQADGRSDGLFRCRTDHFLSLQYLYEYLRQFTSSGMPLKTYVEDVRACYADSTLKPATEFLSHHLFRSAYYTFVAALDRTYEFQCAICKSAPKILICDATAATIRATWYEGTPVTTPCCSADRMVPGAQCSAHHKKRHAGNTRPKRSLAGNNKELRALLADYVKVVKEGGAPIQANHHLLVGTSFKGLPELVRAIELVRSDLGQAQRSAVARFLHALASESAVSSYLPVRVAKELYSYLERDSASLLDLPGDIQALLLTWAPVVAGMLKPLWAIQGAQRTQLLDLEPALLELFIKLAEVSVLCSNPSWDDAGPLLSAPCPPSSFARTCLDTGVCTGLPRVRARFRSDMDGRQEAPADGAPEASACKHGSRKTTQRTGGVFTWFCQHGVCYAFYMLDKAEGRDDAYSFLVSYFETAPEVVVYDFACNLQEYCLNRSPRFFANTLFVVDRLHWDNHQSCSYGFSIDMYTILSAVNSQMAEQANSSLKYIRASVSRMRQRSFMLQMRVYLDEWNARKLAALHVTPSHVANIHSIPLA